MIDRESNPEIIRKEKDYYINYLNIVAYNGAEYTIATQAIEITYYENIFTPSVLLSVTIFDSVDYPSLLPFIGQERLKISFTRQDEKALDNGGFLEPIVLDLAIYKITNRSPEAENRKSQVYTLHAVSDETLKSLKMKVRLGLKDMPYSDMAARVYDEYVKVKKPLEIEPTQFEHDFCIANMPPIRFITHVASNSISAAFGGCAYFFFEDRDKFNFKSLGSLFNSSTVLEINFAPKNILKPGTGDEPKPRNFERDLYTAERYEHKGVDIIKKILMGGFSAKAIYVDPIRQKYNVKNWDLNSEWDSLPHVDKVKPFTNEHVALNAPDSKMNLFWTNAEHDIVPHIAGKEPGIKPFHFEDYSLRVNAQLESLTHYCIDAVLPGTPTITAGSVIHFHLPENLGKISETDPEEKDRYLQGKYLVLSCMHMVTHTEYTTNVTLVKDSFFSDITHRPPTEEYPANKVY